MDGARRRGDRPGRTLDAMRYAPHLSRLLKGQRLRVVRTDLDAYKSFEGLVGRVVRVKRDAIVPSETMVTLEFQRGGKIVQKAFDACELEPLE